MELSDRQKKDLHDALFSAFPSREALKYFVTNSFEESLDTLAALESLEELIDSLIEWAQSHGRLEDLIRAAMEANPGNTELAAFTKTLEGPIDQDHMPAKGALPKFEVTPTPHQTIIISGDYIVGDKAGGQKVTVEDISNSVLAIGQSSSASAGEINTAPVHSKGYSGQVPDVTELRQQLVEKFNLEELQSLCFDLGFDFEEIGGSSKSAKARELVLYMQRRGQLDRLHEAIQQKRG